MDEILKRKIRAMQELSEDGYWEWTIGTTDLYISDRFKILLGYEPEDFPLDTYGFLRSRLNPPDLEYIDAVIDRFVKGESEKYCEEIRYRHKSGKWMDFRRCAQLICDSSGKPILMIGWNKDISETNSLRESERNLEVERDRAISSSKSSKIFLANMSHEIRTPMNSIVALSDLMLRDKALNRRHREYLNCIVGSANILLKLLGDILEYSKLESLELSLNNKRCKMATKKNIIYNTWHEKIKEKGLGFRVHLSNKVPEKVVMDRQRFLQVVNVLLSNALKYTDSGKISVQIYLHHEMLAVRVKDTGVGIPKDAYTTILDPFVRANTKKEGTGIGLSIAKSIIEKIGGQLWFKSKVGMGSTFYFTYPLDYNLDEYSSENNIDSDSFEFENIDVLVVEDNKANQFVMEEVLKQFPNVRYDFANNGEDALVCVSNKTYDVIFMDVVMPGMDGVETTQEIRKVDKSVYIVATTANSISGDREKYTKVMNDYMSKPIIMCEIRNVFNRYSRYVDLGH